MKEWNDERIPLNRERIKRGGFGKKLESKLNKKNQPSSRIDGVVGATDYTLLTNENGEPVQAYVGKRKENGEIKGDIYNRRIKKRENGIIKESHWDNQGKVSGK